jgi:hypothetical protein
MIGLILRIINIKNYKPLNGDLDSILILESDKITVNQLELTLTKIKNIELNCKDYKGFTNSYRPYSNGGFSNGLSNGIKNTIKITMNDNSVHIYNFQQSNKDEINKAKEELINYYVFGKLHFLNLIDALGIREYEDIQKFKETLPPTSFTVAQN